MGGERKKIFFLLPHPPNAVTVFFVFKELIAANSELINTCADVKFAKVKKDGDLPCPIRTKGPRTDVLGSFQNFIVDSLPISFEKKIIGGFLPNLFQIILQLPILRRFLEHGRLNVGTLG